MKNAAFTFHLSIQMPPNFSKSHVYHNYRQYRKATSQQ